MPSSGSSLGRVTDRNDSPDSGRHWADAGAWPTAPGVHRIPLPLPSDGLRAVNVYALESEEGLTLIDGGWAIEAGRAALEKGLAEIGYAVPDIRRFLVTHVHRDHYTLASVVRREVGSHVSPGHRRPAHPRPGAGRRRERPHLRPAPPGRRRGPGPGLGEADPGSSTRTRRTGTTPTRGSSPTTTSPWARARSGPCRRPATRGPLRLRRAGRGAALRRRPRAVHDHPVDRLRAGARRPAARRLPGLLDQGPRARRLRAAARARARRPVGARPHRRAARPPRGPSRRLPGPARPGRSAAYDVAADLTWTRRERSFAELDLFNQTLAVLETRAHLELLVARGVAGAVDTADGAPTRASAAEPSHHRVGGPVGDVVTVGHRLAIVEAAPDTGVEGVELQLREHARRSAARSGS